MVDPTYVKEEIEANPIWSLAFYISEWLNDNAPIGWGRYIQLSTDMHRKFDISPKLRGEP